MVICSNPKCKQKQGWYMAVVKGVNIPDNKRLEVALTSIFGIGLSRAKKIVAQAGITDNPKVHEITEDKLNLIRNLVDSFEDPLEGDILPNFILFNLLNFN